MKIKSSYLLLPVFLTAPVAAASEDRCFFLQDKPGTVACADMSVIKPTDVIVSVNGKATQDATRTAQQFYALDRVTSVPVKVRRDAATVDLSVARREVSPTSTVSIKGELQAPKLPRPGAPRALKLTIENKGAQPVTFVGTECTGLSTFFSDRSVLVNGRKCGSDQPKQITVAPGGRAEETQEVVIRISKPFSFRAGIAAEGGIVAVSEPIQVTKPALKAPAAKGPERKT